MSKAQVKKPSLFCHKLGVAIQLYYCFRENCEITYNPGGCVLNTLRIIQALVQEPSYCVFFGGLGNDKQGELLETEVIKSGVEAR